MTESKFEQAWCKKAKQKGWIPIKMIQTSYNGIPDRMFLKSGKIFFAEFKAKGGRLSELQKARIIQLRAEGFHVLVIKAKS